MAAPAGKERAPGAPLQQRLLGSARLGECLIWKRRAAKEEEGLAQPRPAATLPGGGSVPPRNRPPRSPGGQRSPLIAALTRFAPIYGRGVYHA